MASTTATTDVRIERGMSHGNNSTKSRSHTTLKNNDDDELMCGVCFNDFEFDAGSQQSDRRPVLSATCGHTVCYHCVEQSWTKLQGHTGQCPFCRQKNAFPHKPVVNLLTLKLLRLHKEHEIEKQILLAASTNNNKSVALSNQDNLKVCPVPATTSFSGQPQLKQKTPSKSSGRFQFGCFGGSSLRFGFSAAPAAAPPITPAFAFRNQPAPSAPARRKFCQAQQTSFNGVQPAQGGVTPSFFTGQAPSTGGRRIIKAKRPTSTAATSAVNGGFSGSWFSSGTTAAAPATASPFVFGSQPTPAAPAARSFDQTHQSSFSVPQSTMSGFGAAPAVGGTTSATFFFGRAPSVVNVKRSKAETSTAVRFGSSSLPFGSTSAAPVTAPPSAPAFAFGSQPVLLTPAKCNFGNAQQTTGFAEGDVAVRFSIGQPPSNRGRKFGKAKLPRPIPRR